MKKKALILGTNAGQADMISYLKEQGWEVHACGYRKEGPGCELADEFHLANTVDIDSLVELTKLIQPDIVYSVSSDSAIKSVTRVCEKLKLPHFINSEIIDLFDRKESLRAFMNNFEISTVHYTTVSDINELDSWQIFPCVVKPSDSQGQRGVVLVYSQNELLAAVENAIKWSNSSTAIIEEYLEGIEFSTNVIVQDYQIVVNEFTERFVHGKQYFGLPKGHGIPVRNVDAVSIADAKKMVEKMVQQLKIKDAVLYVQMVATSKGPKIIEVAPRLDGCHIWRMIKIAKGYDLRAYAIDCLLEKKIEHMPKDNGPCSLYFYQQPFGTQFNKSNYNDPENIEYKEFRYNDGDDIVRINGKLEVVGYYVSKE